MLRSLGTLCLLSFGILFFNGSYLSHRFKTIKLFCRRYISLSRLKFGFFGFCCGSLLFFCHLTAVSDKFAGRREFTELMSDHVFSYEYRDMGFTIMYLKSESNHFWSNSAIS